MNQRASRPARWSFPCQALLRVIVQVAVWTAFGAAPTEAGERALPAAPIVTDAGQVAGKRLASGVHAYLGVPFAQAPVQELRWREPQPSLAWTGVLHAERFAPECMQPLRAHNINHYFGEEATSEDCLYLNVWTPPGVRASSRRPVVVWIYGGGFTIGSANMANYRGEALALQGIVYVSVAYRVGALGFLAHPALSAQSPHGASGNFGLLDQVAALHWIQRNINRFGGDPHNVTIAGQSAGSMSVSLLQSSPLARGLFHRLIGMSGGAFGASTAMLPRTLAAAEQDGRQLQQQLGAADLTALRDVPADRIVQAQVSSPLHYWPIIDGYFLPRAPREIFAAKQQNDVPTLVGFTHDESFSSVADARTLREYVASVHAVYGEHADDVLNFYPAQTDAQARLAAVSLGRDSSVALQMRTWARAQEDFGKSAVFAYLFSRVHPYAAGVGFADHDPRTVGAYHAGDVPYWLGTLDSLNLIRTTRAWTDWDRRLSNEMTEAIVAFATTGNPNRAGAPAWPAYRSQDERIMEFADDIRVVSWPNRSALDLLSSLGPNDHPGPTGTSPSRAHD